MKTTSFVGHARGNQSGAALLVVLLLLLIVTLLGVASMRGAIMQERMSSNTMARSMAFQVAEAGLRQAEIMVRDGVITFPASGCSAGRCAMVAPPAEPAWAANRFWATAGGYQAGTPVSVSSSATVTPRFVIENFGQVTTVSSGASGSIDLSKPPPSAGATQTVYRITSYATTPTGGEVILQSLYRR
ncbi:MAG: PilX N-terminal domain-containing pilus assembly protein [Pseudoxanthomonas sp.]